MTNRSLILSIVLLTSLTPLARAHDLWLIPRETADTKSKAIISASVGMDFPKSEFAPDTERYPGKFVIEPAGKQIALKSAGKKGLFALLEFQPTKPGIHVVAVQTTPRVIELEAAKFNEYLVTDGLAHIFRLRFKEKTLDKPGIERYQKSPKALLAIGDSDAGLWNQPTGLPLEIVPIDNPFRLKPRETMRVKVLFHGKPLPAANLGFHRPGDGDTPAGTIRTNERGEAMIPIVSTGLMTIRLTHMTRPRHADYEWESFWTTLTFRIPR